MGEGVEVGLSLSPSTLCGVTSGLSVLAVVGGVMIERGAKNSGGELVSKKKRGSDRDVPVSVRKRLTQWGGGDDAG